MPPASKPAGGNLPVSPHPDADLSDSVQRRVIERAWRICAETPGGCGIGRIEPCGWCLAEARAELEAGT